MSTIVADDYPKWLLNHNLVQKMQGSYDFVFEKHFTFSILDAAISIKIAIDVCLRNNHHNMTKPASAISEMRPSFVFMQQMW